MSSIRTISRALAVELLGVRHDGRVLSMLGARGHCLSDVEDESGGGWSGGGTQQLFLGVERTTLAFFKNDQIFRRSTEMGEISCFIEVTVSSGFTVTLFSR